MKRIVERAQSELRTALTLELLTLFCSYTVKKETTALKITYFLFCQKNPRYYFRLTLVSTTRVKIV